MEFILVVICFILVYTNITLVIKLDELKFIHELKHCKHNCIECVFAQECHESVDSTVVYTDNGSPYMKKDRNSKK